MTAKRACGRLLLFAASVLFSASCAISQDPGGGAGMPGGGAGQPSGPGSQPGGYPNGAPGGMAGGGAGGGSSQSSMIDQSFVREMMQSDAVEVQLGQLAQEKSQSDDVKQFAEKMVENRKRLDEQLAALAKQMDVSQPNGPDKKTKKEIEKMQALSGPQFDEEYIRTIEKAHEKDVKSFKQAAESSQNPNVQKTAQTDAPVIEQHLAAIQKLAQAHNVQADDKKK
jgi:putative membrane protein